MISFSRRAFLAQAAVLIAAPRAWAQQPRHGLFSHLRKEGPAELPPEAHSLRVFVMGGGIRSALNEAFTLG
jgi:hypothetical protein